MFKADDYRVADMPSWADRRLRHFFDTRDIFDNVCSRIWLSELETDVIDTPEFQRLFRVSQLGLVDLVYPTANHRRGAHAVGTSAWAKRLVATINANQLRTTASSTSDSKSAQLQLPLGERADRISFTSRALISLSALVHDLPHGPLSHEIEKKTHMLVKAGETDRRVNERVQSHCGPYLKHDDLSRNPALYLMLMDTQSSVLARVLRAYSPSFWRLLTQEATYDPDSQWELQPLVQAAKKVNWPSLPERILPQLVLHLLAGERESDFDSEGRLRLTTFWGRRAEPWGLGPEDDKEASAVLHEAWYQPYRHDIVGNTLSADLLDYLHRDTKGLGIPFTLDERFLDYLVLAPAVGRPDRLSCALDLVDVKRHTLRLEVIKDLFDLLNQRYVIHQKAVLHRVAQAAVAMLWRSISLIPADKRPAQQRLFDWDASGGRSGLERARYGDEMFLSELIALAQSQTDRHAPRQVLPLKLAERRIHKPLVVFTGDQVLELLDMRDQSDDKKQEVLREVAAIIDSERYCAFFREVEWMLEAYLSHAVPGESLPGLIQARAKALGEADPSLQRPRASARVIFWALPFKQFYKDPSIRLWLRDKRTGGHDSPKTIEDLRREADSLGSPDLKSLLDAGIRNADANYRAVWQVSVFLSDGLFYRGILAKASPNLCADTQAHQAHLETAREVVVRALLVAWQENERSLLRDTWRRHQLDPNKPGPPVHPLDQPLAAAKLGELIRRMGEIDVEGYVRGKLSEVGAGIGFFHYVHESAIAGEELQPFPVNCRDVRSKFDGPDDPTSRALQLGVLEGTEYPHAQLGRLLDGLREVVAEPLSESEVDEIIGRLGEAFVIDRPSLEPSMMKLMTAPTYGESTSELIQSIMALVWAKTCGH